MSSTSDNITRSAFPVLNMMMNMQRLGLQAMSVYQPLVSTFLDAASTGVVRGAAPERRGSNDTNEERVIGIGEEVLTVGTRMVAGKTTRVRRVVVQNPVQQDVTLHTETVVLERRRPVHTSGGDVLTEVTIEMSDFNEVPVVSKSVHLVEEVLLRKEVTARVETIHDTVRRDTLQIEQPSTLPAVVTPAPKPEEKKRDDTVAADGQERKQPGTAMQAVGKSSEQKRS